MSVWQALQRSAIVNVLHGAVWQAPQWLPRAACVATPPSACRPATALSGPGLNRTGPLIQVNRTSPASTTTAAATPSGDRHPSPLCISPSSADTSVQQRRVIERAEHVRE